MSLNKRTIASILTALMIINIFAVFLMPNQAFASVNAWQELRSGQEGLFVFNQGENLIYVSKSGISVRIGGEWNTKYSSIDEIQAGHMQGNSIFLITNKNDARTIYTSYDGGNIWSSTTFPTDENGIKSNKIEGIFALDNSEIYIVVEKKGVYYSDDGGESWSQKSGNLPTEPDKSDYDARVIKYYNGKLYVGTKKQGVYMSADNGENWTLIQNNTGLSNDKSKEVFDILLDGNTLYIATKDGVYSTDTASVGQYNKVQGISDEVKGLKLAEGRIYSIIKEKKIYYLDTDGKFKVFDNQTSGVSLDECRSFDYYNGYFYVAHKKGLLQIEDAAKPIDKTSLWHLILSGQAKVSAAVEGDAAGEYQIGSKATLTAAIEIALITYGLENPTEAEINAAILLLSNAIGVFEASRNPDAWHQLSSEDSHHVLTVNGKILLITKNSVLLSSTVGWDTKLSGINEIGATYAYGDAIYLIGNNDGKKAFYKSTNNGESFTNMLGNGKTLPSGIGENKIEGLYVAEEGIFIVGEKKGVYYSSNDGETWTQINNSTLPTSSEPKKIWNFNGKFYVSTKKQGLYESVDGVAWSLVKNSQGLSSEKEKEISDALAVGDMLYIATKEGIFSTNISDVNGWTKVPGISGEAKGLLNANNKVYAIAKDSKIYYLDNTASFSAFTNQTAGVTLEEFRSFTFDGQVFFVAGKKGLLRIEDDYKELNLASIAAAITADNPIINATSIPLPTVPNGYTIKLVYTSDNTIVDLEGKITLKDVPQTVNLRYEVTKLEDSTTAETPNLLITIPGKVASGENDGVFEGVGKGKNGNIKVAVTVVGGQIVAIEVLEHKESIDHSTYGAPVRRALFTDLPQSIIAAQSLDVDTITNATASSNGLKQAILDALKETSHYNPSENEWKSYSIDAKEGVLVFAVKDKYLYITKKDKKSDVHLVDNDGNYVTKLSNVGEIDTGYRVPNTDTIYLIGRKESNALYVSHDGGESWGEPMTTQGIQSEKIEALLVVNSDEMYISVSKYGLYRSNDGGISWEQYNNNLPKNPEKSSEYDSRKLWKINGSWYIGTKKQGILTSTDGISWTSFKTTGLSSDAKDVWDMLIRDNDIYINTKAGVWRTKLNDSSQWEKVEGFSGEGRSIISVDGRIYAFAKNGNSYYLEDNTFKLMLPTPSGASVEDVKAMDYANGYFVMAHKSGLERIYDLLKPQPQIDTDTSASPRTDTDSSASSAYNAAPVSVPVIAQYNTTAKLDSIKLEKSSDGSAISTITKESIDKLFKENTGVKTVELEIKEAFNSLRINLEAAAFKELKDNNITIVATFNKGSYSIPTGLKALETAAVGKGELLSISLKIEDISAEMPDSHRLVVQPLKFTLEAEFKNGTVEVSSFGREFVERRLLVPNAINIKKSTGVVFEDGVWKAVPTTFATEGGKTYAIIKRNANSIYSVMETEVSFRDIDGHWSQETVELLAAKKILEGNDGSYLPEGILTRAQFIAMLVRSLGLKTVSTKTTGFKDVEVGSWYESYVYTAVDFGIAQGNSDGTFKPDKAISREEMVAMIMRAIELIGDAQGQAGEAGGSKLSKWLDGEYEAAGTGFKSSIKVKVTIKAGDIQSIKILENGDSVGVGDVAAAGMVNRIISQQSTMVDTYTGATSSSKGLLEAVNKALDKAVNTENPLPEENTVKPMVMFKDDAGISSWAFEAVYKAAAKNIVAGYEDTSFRPQNTSTRAEAAVVIMKMLLDLDFINN